MSIRVLLFLILSLPTLVFAESQGFKRTLYRPKKIENAEWILRNPSVGLYNGTDFNLKTWIRVDEHATLGIDEAGRAVQVIQTPTRTIAFLLSGDRKIKDIFLFAPSLLFAIDTQGEILQFQWPRWKEDRWPETRDRIALQGAFVAAGIYGAAAFLAHIYHVPLLGMEVVMAELSGLTGVGFLSAYRGILAYERMNQATDGFQPLGKRIANYQGSRPVWQNNEVIDYKLLGGSDDGSLLKLIEARIAAENDPEQHFNYKCEHDLLPRGIPPGEYEPQL